MSLKKNIIKIYKTIIYKFKPKTNLDNKKINLSSLNELFNHFGTDKGTKVINPYYKGAKDIIGHGYAKFYEEHLKYYKDKDLSLLEIGTWKGGSAASFFYYLKKARIFCLDINFKFEFSAKRIEFFNCNTNLNKDIKKLDKFLIKKKYKNFDIIIDDGSHIYSEMLKNFEIFFKKVKPGGIYIIEDFNAYKSYSYLNDTNQTSLDIEDILHNLKSQISFNSPFVSSNFQNFCLNEISDININKGDSFINGVNMSGICFIKKKTKHE